MSVFLGILFDQSRIRFKARFMGARSAKMNESVSFRVNSGLKTENSRIMMGR